MYSKFPFSMENIPRQTSFACLSLKFGCIFSALIIILYSVLGLAQCVATVGDLAPHLAPKNVESVIAYAVIISVAMIHSITLFLTAVMLIGTLREKTHLMKPWIIWTSLLVMGYLLLFVFWTTMNMINHAAADNSLLVYVIDFLGLLIRFYMLMLVSSYHKQLEEEQYAGEPLKQSYHSNDTWYSSA